MTVPDGGLQIPVPLRRACSTPVLESRARRSPVRPSLPRGATLPSESRSFYMLDSLPPVPGRQMRFVRFSVEGDVEVAITPYAETCGEDPRSFHLARSGARGSPAATGSRRLSIQVPGTPQRPTLPPLSGVRRGTPSRGRAKRDVTPTPPPSPRAGSVPDADVSARTFSRTSTPPHLRTVPQFQATLSTVNGKCCDRELGILLAARAVATPPRSSGSRRSGRSSNSVCQLEASHSSCSDGVPRSQDSTTVFAVVGETGPESL